LQKNTAFLKKTGRFSYFDKKLDSKWVAANDKTLHVKFKTKKDEYWMILKLKFAKLYSILRVTDRFSYFDKKFHRKAIQNYI
jgi:hypothetical protein